MATLPKSDPSPRYLTAEQMLSMRGTPEYDAEFKRQMLAIAEHDKRNGNASRMEVDWAALESLGDWE